MAERRPRLAVLIPAHNEATVIAGTLASIIPQMEAGDKLIVVADNCSDDTAALAAAAGAQVIERCDKEERGKGFALAYGMARLRQSPPEAVIMIDADCIVRAGSIGILARTAINMDKPVQALNLMCAGQQSSPGIKVAGFAWVVKNHVRALGLSRLGLSCQLMGTGMAFPWHIIEKSEFADVAIVEDMQMGIELALQGHLVHFCPDALVVSSFPLSEQNADTQRRRWEHGHISMILQNVPKLFLVALRKMDMRLLALCLDLMVPPLALQSLLLLAGLIVAACAIPFGLFSPFIVLFFGCLLFALALILVWYRFARDIISIGELLAIPAYVFSKLPVYTAYVFSRESKWIKTERDSGE